MAIQEDEDLQVYTSGTTNILKYPELSDLQRASDILDTFETKDGIRELVEKTIAGSEESGLTVYIGNENQSPSLKDCSVVTATYDLGDGMKGMIGIVGPRRMDYENVVDSLKTIKTKLDQAFKR